ncbi:efflux RND transporter periplasmic adaptor subunit [Pedobacter cryophilus]|uniref:Efflux RND transporter periplasmic adaptor subunit n=1 Tax=Pedobacter cryophilus TaxID=2571271 RepID=A0A4U1C3J6_9SPHI|nr:efflux RND transporter periplasmic adaptor subunit [Pedobacter cryophilus]TKB97774.1 efflux RND transporter periplasmic adaptor subunit [Pedobacter cryophilus]
MKLTIYLIFISILFAGCSQTQPAEEVENKLANNLVSLSAIQMKNADISVAKMELKSISSILKVNGKIDVPPQNVVSISIPLGGYLKSTKLLPGMHLNKGEVIAVIEDQQYIQLQQDYLTAKVKIIYLEKEYQRQKELNESQASSNKVYQQVEADYRSQKVLITALSQKLALVGINPKSISENNITRSINVYSPINGYVSMVNVNIGKYVSPTDILFELINPKDIHLALTIFEKDIEKLFIGQQLEAYTNYQPENKHQCEIILIGRDLSNNGTTEVHCHFENFDKKLIPGTYMNAEIKVKNKQAMTLPADAIVRFEGKQYVFVKKNKSEFEMVEVKLGDSENGFTEIINQKNNLEAEDFVVKGAYSLLMLMKNTAEE